MFRVRSLGALAAYPDLCKDTGFRVHKVVKDCGAVSA